MNWATAAIGLGARARGRRAPRRAETVEGDPGGHVQATHRRSSVQAPLAGAAHRQARPQRLPPVCATNGLLHRLPCRRPSSAAAAREEDDCGQYAPCLLAAACPRPSARACRISSSRTTAPTHTRAAREAGGAFFDLAAPEAERASWCSRDPTVRSALEACARRHSTAAYSGLHGDRGRHERHCSEAGHGRLQAGSEVPPVPGGTLLALSENGVNRPGYGAGLRPIGDPLFVNACERSTSSARRATGDGPRKSSGDSFAELRRRRTARLSGPLCIGLALAGPRQISSAAGELPDTDQSPRSRYPTAVRCGIRPSGASFRLQIVPVPLRDVQVRFPTRSRSGYAAAPSRAAQAPTAALPLRPAWGVAATCSG
jgi:hypothetical protein